MPCQSKSVKIFGNTFSYQKSIWDFKYYHFSLYYHSLWFMPNKNIESEILTLDDSKHEICSDFVKMTKETG